MPARDPAGSPPRRPALRLPAAVAASAVAVAVAAAVLAAPLPQHAAAWPEAAAACGAGQAPPDPACAAGPPAAAPGEGRPDGAAAGRQERRPPEAAPYASSGYADLPNPSNTTISVHSRPYAGEPLGVVLTTTLPPAVAVMHGNGSMGVFEFPDGHEDGEDTSVHVLFGGDVAVLSSDPALGAPSRGEAGGSAYTEIGGTLAATPGREYRFEFTVLPAEEGVTVIDAAGFLRGAARLVLDVAPAAGRGAAGHPQSAAAPDPPGRAGPPAGEPRGGRSLGDEIRAAAAAPLAPAPAGAGYAIPAGGWAWSDPGAADAGTGDLVLFGQIRLELPYSDSMGPARGLLVCAVDVGAGSRRGAPMSYADGTDACARTDEHGLYVLGPLNATDPDGDGTGPDPGILAYSYGGGVSVRNKTGWTYHEAAGHYLQDRAAGIARLDMDLGTPEMNGAARIVDAVSDAEAFFEGELGAEIPPVTVYWQYGERIMDAWPDRAGGRASHAFYVPFHSEIFLDGLDAVRATGDVSESRYVIQHEYGHHAHSHLGGTPEGCAHAFRTKVSPGCAFGEGLAYFVPHAVDGAPELREYENTYVDMERELRRAGEGIQFLFDYSGSLDRQTEIQVAGALWDVHDEPADGIHDRRRTLAGGTVVAEGGILDDLHVGAGEIVRIVRDGPQNAEQFYARWEKEEGLGSMESIMDLHRMRFGPPDLPVFAAVPAVEVDYTGEASVPVAAAAPGGAGVSLDARQGFENERGYEYGGAFVDDGGNGAGTLVLRPARADVGEGFVVVRASSPGGSELARVGVTVGEPPKWAPVQLNSTFDRGFADWTPDWGDVGRWRLAPDGGSPSPPGLVFRAGAESNVTLDRGIDVTAYGSAVLGLSRSSPPLEPGSYLRAYASDGAGPWTLLEEWGAGNATGGFRQEAVPLPAGLMDAESLVVRLAARGLPADPSREFSVLIDNVTVTGARGGGPAIEAPGDAAVEAESPAGAAADIGAPRTDPAALAVAREPPGPLPLGTTAVTWTATDEATGESDSDTQLVDVVDTTPPSVTPPADYAVRAAGAAVSLSANDYCSASAEDAVSGTILLHTPTAALPVGETSEVTWLALDRSGNHGTAVQRVAVERSGVPRAPASAVAVWAEPGAEQGPAAVHVGFSHPVVLTAAMSGEAPGSLLPSLEMAGGGKAEYESGNGTARLTFSYAARPGEGAPDYAGPHALGGPCTIRSAADNRGADAELPDPGPPGLPGPPDAPRVAGVYSDMAAGVYGEGSAIAVRVNFSDAVAVGGSPSLLLEAGPPGAAAAYANGSGTRSLAFEYTVRAADAAADLDYSGTGALVLNGGSVASPWGAAADLTLPDPAAEPGLLAGPGGITLGTKPHARVGVFAGGPGDPAAAAARLGAAAFNGRSAERGYAAFVDVSEHELPAGAPAREAEAALREAHDGGRGPVLYVGPASDAALRGMAGYAAENGITLVSHSSAARSLAAGGDGIFRLEPGAAHMAMALARMVADGGFGAAVPVVQADLYGPEYGLLEPLASGLAGAGIPAGRPVEFREGGDWAAAAESIEAAVLAAGGEGTARNVAVIYAGSDSALAAIAGNTGAGSPVRERSAWFAAGGGVAASPLVLSDAAALEMARDVRLAAVQFAVERNDVTDEIDGAANGTAASSTPAYAAYEAARILGRALALAGGDPSGAGARVARAADLDGGPLGRMSLDRSGDLRLPITYGAWSVSSESAKWERAPDLLRGMDMCGIAMEKSSLALPSVSPGRASGPARQTITNTGTVPLPGVTISATDWDLRGSGGSGPGATLPSSLTEISVESAGFAPLANGTAILNGTLPGDSAGIDFRINLAGVPSLEADYIAQTVTYGVNC